MRKIAWVSEFYVYICISYLEKKPERAKKTLEEMLFLMQYDSLHNDKKPMLPYKIYIYENKIRVRYISDLLRVTKAMGNFWVGGGKSLPTWRSFNDMLKYIELSKRYKNLTPNMIELRVQRIIKNETLNSKYFVFKKYDDKWMRKLARIFSQEQEHQILFLIWAFIMTFLVAIVLMIIFVLIATISNMVTINTVIMERIVQAGIMFVVIAIPWLIWTRKWTGPTQYEIKKNLEYWVGVL